MTKPKIVCLCGSTRFYEQFQEANYRETMAGKIVLSVGFYPHAQSLAHGEEKGCTPEQKIALDELHKRKIDLADEVLVLNVNGYAGDSTRSEIEYAIVHSKPIRWLEPVACVHAWRLAKCRGENDLMQCTICGKQRVTPCTFDSEYD
jgi:hypothetical protein